jgi:CubicO group peptidase (beta-lactamase class C family)
MHRILVPVVGCLLAACAIPVAAQTLPQRELDAYIVRALRDWQVPGLAVAVVQDDSVVLARGYGVRQLGRPEPVTEHTVFAAASTTKAMTATALGMLVDEGRLHWDDAVVRHLPGFRLFDERVTGELTVRDLLAHRTGLPRGDLLWWASPYSREEVVYRVRHLRPRWEARSRFSYNNLMYVALGQLLETTAENGASWDGFLEERLFRPLGMRRTTTSAYAAHGAGNVAVPHIRVDGRVRSIPWRSVDNLGAAGAVNSSAWDMAQWVRFNLRRGTAGDARLLSDSVARALHSHQIGFRADSATERLFPEVTRRGYALGWAVQEYRGWRVVHHDGALDGMRTQVMMIPELGVGVVVMANHSPTDLHTAVAYRVLDAYLHAPPRDWSRELLAAAQERQLRRDRLWQDFERARVTGTRPSLPLAAFAGVYADSLYGEMTVDATGDRLVLRYGEAWAGDLEHWHYNTFRATWRDDALGRTTVTFAVGSDGGIRSMSVHEFGAFGRAAGSGRTPAGGEPGADSGPERPGDRRAHPPADAGVDGPARERARSESADAVEPPAGGPAAGGPAVSRQR